MLVICDFLLLSMLALARFDPPEAKSEATLDATAASATAEAELIELLEDSLASELNSRENLNEDLAQTRENLQTKARELAEREAVLAITQQTLEQTSAEAKRLAQTKAEIEGQQERLTAEKAQVEADRAQLAERFETTRTQLESANSQRVQLATTLGQLKVESSVAQERLYQSEEELIAREIILAEREAALKAAEEDKQRLTQESFELTRKLDIAQAEGRLLKQNLTQEQGEKQQLQQEKEAAFARADRLGENVSELGKGVTQIGEGVNTIKEASDRIQKEIEASRPQTASEIFTRFQKNRATIQFKTTEKTVFGGTTQRSYESQSILISDTDGTTYLVTHTSNTPFVLSKNPDSVLAISLNVSIAGRSLTINQVGFLGNDPRLLFIPLPAQLVTNSGLETFPLALQPERWEEAILVKNDESNFGRTGFRRLTSSERFLKMDRPALGELFSDFASSRGDLVFTKNGQFIGAMIDTNHAVVISGFLAAGIVNVGNGYNATDHDATADRLQDRLRKLPAEVQ